MTAHSLSNSSTSRGRFVWKSVGRLVRFQPLSFFWYSIFALVVFGLQVVPGLIVKRIFDTIAGVSPVPASQYPAEWYLWGWVGLYAAVELVRLFFAFGLEWNYSTFWLTCSALLRRNVFSSLLRRTHERHLPVSPGEAINRLRIDVGEIADFPAWLPDQVGKWIAALIAVVIMARINLPITLIVFLPLIGTIVITRLVWGRMLEFRRISMGAEDAVTGFLGETFNAVQAVKVADAAQPVVAHLDQLSYARSQAVLRYELSWGLLNSLNNSLVTFGIGVMLLLAGTAIHAGSFTIGDFALFVSYLWFTTQVPSEIGTFYGDFKTQEVSVERLHEMIEPEAPDKLIEIHPVYSRSRPPEIGFPSRKVGDRLESLHVQGLTFHYPAADDPQSPVKAESGHNLTFEAPQTRGWIEGVNLAIQRGEFVVVTGRVGSGKSTLLRVLLGILPAEAGEIAWNGQVVDDPWAFFRPPRCAYIPQVPRLFSQSLRENMLMGLPEEQTDLPGAIRQSVLEDDIEALSQGLDTLVGPRGIRLSGGQVKRVAAARMFVPAPELLLIDDLSSALDVETEQVFWERLDEKRHAASAEGGFTCLVVSHRRAALRRADRILVMKEGRLEAEGKLDELLAGCPEMVRLWEGQAEGDG
jgi:ATP-binding cassette subfamily B protein